MSLSRYPEYKDSGVEWLGKVPAHWNVAPLKRHFRLVTDRAITKRRAVALENIEGWSGRYIETEGEFQGDGTSFETDDLLFGKLRPYLAKVLLADFPGEAVGDFHVLRPSRNLYPRFAQYQMLQREFISVVDGSTFGSKMPRAGWEALGGMPFVVPDVSEQKQIALFLDRETARIDTLIAEQETLLALLAEKRQATISHAVTRGLDPNVPMKDSGIAWLGEVPAHWLPQKIGHAFDSIGSGTTPPSDESHWYIDGTIPWVTTGELREDVVITTSKYVTQEAIATFGALKIHPAGALVIAMYGATIGRLGVLGVPATTNQACCVLSGPRTLDVRFTFYWLHCQKQKIVDLYATGGGQPNINRETVSSLRVPAPGLVEQAQIAAYLDTACARLRQLQTLSERSISSLKERRSALIAAAVTGQIDVRGLVDRDTA